MTVTGNTPEDQGKSHQHAAVMKAGLIAAGGFVSAIATILVAAGTNAISDATTRYALTMVCVISLATLAVLMYYFRR